MNTHTSKRSIWMRSVLLLPVLAILLYGFTEREQVIRKSSPPNVIELYLNEDGILLQQNEAVTFKDIEALYRKDSKLQVSVNIFPDANVSIGKNISSKLRAIGIKNITVCASRVAEFLGTPQDSITPKQLAEYNKLAKYYNTQNSNNQIVKHKYVDRLEHLYKLMSDTQKENAQPYPIFPPPPPAPPKKVITSEITWVLLNSKGQFLLNDKSSTLEFIELELKVIASVKRNSKEIIFKHDDDAPQDLINKVNAIIANYNLKNITDNIPPPPPAPPKTKSGNGPNVSTYYPVPPPIPEDATPDQRVKMQTVIDDFEKTYKRKVHQLKMSSGEMISIVADDDYYDPSKQDNYTVKTGFIKINGTPHYFVSINDTTKYYNRKGYEVNKKGKTISEKQINASDVIPGQYITKVYSNDKIVAEFNNNKPKSRITREVNISPPPAPPKIPVTVVKSKLTWISLNRKGQILLNDKLGTLTSVEAEFKRIQNNKSVSRDIVFKYDKDAPKVIISKVNEFINTYNLVNINDTLPPPPPLAPRVKKGESSKIPPPPAPPKKQ